MRGTDRDPHELRGADGGDDPAGSERDRARTRRERRGGEREAAGAPVPAEVVREALRQVVDPEVGLDVVTMGLIYEVSVTGSRVRVRHTLTAPGCPLGDLLSRWIAQAAGSVSGVDEVETELVWEPGWHPGMIEDDAW